MFKEAIIPFLYKLEIKEKGTLPNTYCEASIILISRPDEVFTRTVQSNVSYEYRCRNPKQNINRLK